MTVGDLMEILTEYDEELEVRVSVGGGSEVCECVDHEKEDNAVTLW